MRLLLLVPSLFLLTACDGGVSAPTTELAVTTSTPRVVAVDVSPSQLSLTVGQYWRLTAANRDSAGNAVAGRVTVWLSTDITVATVGVTDGMVQGLAPGTATILATTDGRQGQSVVTVR
jgi:uncharacterized protein YjdB